MKINFKKLLLLFVINGVVTFTIFLLLEEDRSCVMEFGTKCSNRYFFRCAFQTILMTFLFYYLSKKNEKVKG